MVRQLDTLTGGHGRKVGIVQSRFNTVVVDRLLDSAIRTFESAGVHQLVLAFHDPHDHAALELFAGAIESFRGSP